MLHGAVWTDHRVVAATTGKGLGLRTAQRMLLSLTEWFWKHEFWLPPGITWEDMKETDEIRYPQPHHLLLGILCSFLLIGLRLTFERQVMS
uniref:Uncharacterized protein n=1 Tax=Sphaerodactylus townsendi TaxID=933632 RepID=A0ACB8F0M4_9SAUR